MTFETAIAHLTTLGVEYHQDYDYGKQGTAERHPFDVPVLTNVLLPFSAEEWCSLCMTDGDQYMGGCCGTLSAAQDHISYAFRFGSGWIDGGDYHEMADLLANHDEMESAFMFSKLPKDDDAIAAMVGEAKKQWDEISPWQKMAVIYAAVRPYLRPRAAKGVGKHLTPLEGAISTSGRMLQSLSYERVFRSEADTSQSRAMRTLVLARLIPSFKIVYEQIASLYEGPLEGFALIDVEAGIDVVVDNRLGSCIYATREEVEEILRITREQEKHYEERNARMKPVDERLGVRRVRVTLEKGLEFLDEGPAPTK